MRLAIILKPPVLYRFMETLAYVVKHDPGFFVPGQGKPYTIGITVSRHVAASTSIADIAELAQFGFRWSDLIVCGVAGTGKPGA